MYAFSTLLMISKDYLPGIILLGKKLRNIIKSSEEKQPIETVCMVTKDIPEEVRQLIGRYWDHVQEVEYVSIDTKFRPYFRAETFNTYRHTFTKLQVLNLTKYKKILYIDADNIPTETGAKSLLEAFTKYDAPAGVYMGPYSIWKTTGRLSAEEFAKERIDYWNGDTKYINTQPHKKFLDQDKILGTTYIGTETCVFLVEPSVEEFNRLISLFKEAVNGLTKTVHQRNPVDFMAPRRVLSADTTFLAIHWADKWHALDYRFLGRWVKDPDSYFIVDSFGNQGKPWSSRVDDSYDDVKYWRSEFLRNMNKSDYTKLAEICPDVKKIKEFSKKYELTGGRKKRSKKKRSRK